MYISFCVLGRVIHSNGADEFYEAINIGDTGHVISRAHTVVEGLAKSTIEAVTSFDLW